MVKARDLTGQTFNRLIVIPRTNNTKGGKTRWLCKCSCGSKLIIVQGSNLVSGNTQSCGCLQKECSIQASYLHGYGSIRDRNKTYKTWGEMIDRCTNPNNKSYHNYGGRGIKVCSRWRESDGRGFINFLQDMGERPKSLSIDRINVNGNYGPHNCRWSTQKEQCRNTRNNILITINNKTQCLSAWCEEFNLRYQTIWMRIKSGWPSEEALELVPRHK